MNACTQCGGATESKDQPCARCGHWAPSTPPPLGWALPPLPQPPFPEGPKQSLAPSQDLAHILAQAPPGSTLQLPPGRFALPPRATLRKTIRLQGAGATQTLLVGAGSGWALRVDENAFAVLENLSLVHEGLCPSDVLVVAGGMAALKAVVLQGGAAGQDWGMAPYQAGGRGLVAWAEAKLWLEGCELVRHASDALVLLDHAQAHAHRCLALQNRGTGFLATGQSQLKLEACELIVNFRDGLQANEHARAQAIGCKAGRNGAEGFASYGGAEMGLLDCQAAENRKSGMAAYHHAKLWMHGGKSKRNQEHGLRLDDAAQSQVSGFQSEENGLSGLAILGQSSGVLRGNLSAGNKALGVQLGAFAEVQMNANQITHNALGEVGRMPAAQSPPKGL